MKRLLDFAKAIGLVAAAIAALIAGPIIAAIVSIIFAIWIAYLILSDHRSDLNILKNIPKD